MSSIFYDHLISLDEVEKLIKESVEAPEEREELWQLIDEIIHHKVLGCIFDHLPKEHHAEFLEKIHKFPHDHKLISYLNNKITQNIEEIIKQEIGNLTYELLQEFKAKN
ncbi:hypothetical protein HYT59_00520 [Candidatus Woesebacteria bacterium]|nr:hypothetical protein [Candidatus Woesebacteria bacterium]